MPSWPTYRQTVVYWGSPVPDGYGGFTFAEAVEKTVRYEQKQELYTDENMEQKAAKAIVFSAEAFDLGGFVFEGSFVDLDSDTSNPVTCGAFEIVHREKIPSVKGTKFIYVSYLGAR